MSSTTDAESKKPDDRRHEESSSIMTDLDYSRLFPRLARKYGEDIAQEALIRCWQAPGPIEYLTAYAYKVARNLILARARTPREHMLVFVPVLPMIAIHPAQSAYVELGELVNKLPALVWDAVGYPLPGRTLGARRLRRLRYRRKIHR